MNAVELTERQMSILVMVSKGYTREQMAAELFISVSTVKSHKEHVLKALGAKTQAEAIANAFRMGLLS